MAFSTTKLFSVLSVIAVMTTACGGGGGGSSSSTAQQTPSTPDSSIPDDAYFDEPIVSTYAYKSDSPYAGDLSDCTYSNQLTQSCAFSRLPLVAQSMADSLSTPTIEEIMDRVVVSHDWMGENFEQFLRDYDHNDDFKKMLRATTAVVIASDVRPSFYWAATGAIYLDPETLWLTPAQRNVIDTAPDYRSGFGAELQFVMPWRYTKDNNYAWAFYPQDEEVTRSFDDIEYDFASLLYHELAHANDYFPSTEWHSHNMSTSVLEAAVSSDLESDALTQSYPLVSQEMLDLATVRFRGEDASNTQKAYTPEDVASFFSQDSATDFYAYTTPAEDYAMLFEELMMAARYQVYRDVAVTNLPQGENVSGVDYIVTWGERRRMTDSDIQPRVIFATNRILPDFDARSALENTPARVSMRVGDNWIENLVLDAQPTSLSLAQGMATSASLTHGDHMHRATREYYKKPLPKK